MAVSMLDRFRDRRYMNWLKVKWGLDSVRTALLGITEEKIRKFYNGMKNKYEPCCGSCRTEDLGPGGKPKKKLCENCDPWVTAIAGLSSDGFGCIWPNTDVKTWNTNYWEIAKVFMYITDAKKTGKISTGPDMDDDVKLLHLCLNCKLFRKQGQDKEKIQAVIDIRNVLAHSPTPTLDSDVTDRYLNDMIILTYARFIRKEDAKRARLWLDEYLSSDAFPFELALEDKSSPAPKAQEQELQDPRLKNSQVSLRDNLEIQRPALVIPDGIRWFMRWYTDDGKYVINSMLKRMMIPKTCRTLNVPVTFAYLSLGPAAPQALQDFVQYVNDWLMGENFLIPADWPVFQMDVRTYNDVKGWHLHLNIRAGNSSLSMYLVADLPPAESKMLNAEIKLVAREQRVRERRARDPAADRCQHASWDRYVAEGRDIISLMLAASPVVGPREARVRVHAEPQADVPDVPQADVPSRGGTVLSASFDVRVTDGRNEKAFGCEFGHWWETFGWYRLQPPLEPEVNLDQKKSHPKSPQNPGAGAARPTAEVQSSSIEGDPNAGPQSPGAGAARPTAEVQPSSIEGDPGAGQVR